MRIVGHLDMDAFFAAIEERDDPGLQGLPIVVGADPREGKGRGVVSTANYQARKYGIHSAMPISRAWWLSETARKRGKPPAVFLPVAMKRYAEVSGNIMALLRRFVSVVEQASIDEAY
jgi:DNA polymerase IV (DinB-like DNA polymerase)